jgi:predicted amidohydrolase
VLRRSDLRVGFVQFDPEFGAPERNLARVTDLIRSIEADLLVLPELFTSGYQFVNQREVTGLAEPVPHGPTVRALARLARDQNLWIVAGIPERAGRRCFNSAVIVGPRGWRGTYRKAHLFYEEKRWFAPGDGAFPVYDIGAARVGVMVCFDWFFPEVARALALAGADVIAHPANLVLPYCPEAMITRCLENRVFAVTANRIGTEQRGGKRPLTYIGQSEIVAPDGRVLVRAGAEETGVGLATIDPRTARDKRLNRYNHLLRDRRAALYRPLTRTR